MSQSPTHPIKSLLRTPTVVAVSMIMFAVYFVLRLITRSRSGRIKLAQNYCRAWCRVICAIGGITIRVKGAQPPRGAMLAPNHVGYCDILALSAAVPCTFVTRTEILRWPVIGYILKSFEQPAVDRVHSRDLKSAAEAITRGLREGKTLAVFLEGTSTGGDRVLPFRTTVVQAAVDAGAPIVPVAIRWTSDDPSVDLSDRVAYWKKSHDFGSHGWRFFGVSGSLTAEITFTEAMDTQRGNRKQLAADARERVMTLTALPAGETLPRSPESAA